MSFFQLYSIFFGAWASFAGVEGAMIISTLLVTLMCCIYNARERHTLRGRERRRDESKRL